MLNNTNTFFDKFENGEMIEYYGHRAYPFPPFLKWHEATFVGKWSVDQAIVKSKFYNEPKIAHYLDIRKLETEKD